ncbi:MAG: transposase [Lachnospiraceae bacterium]|nr:transposase [Lachnospiraceae bacterium]
MALFTESSAFQNPCTGISFVDCMTLDVCDNHRIQQNRVFRGTAMRRKSSTG